MPRIKLSATEKEKRKLSRRANKKLERAANKLNKQAIGKKIKGSTRKTTGLAPANIVEVEITNKAAISKMAEKVENGKARNHGYVMGNLIYELIK